MPIFFKAPQHRPPKYKIIIIISTANEMRRTNQILCLAVALLGLVSSGEGLDLGKIFKRRAKRASKELGVEELADEVLSYSTACDKELAKSMVVLEEQAMAAKDALDFCRDHREKARSEIDSLTLKVENTSQQLAEADDQCTDKMKSVEVKAEAKVAEAAGKIEEIKAILEESKNEHASEIQRLASEHEVALQQATEMHKKVVDELVNEIKLN